MGPIGEAFVRIRADTRGMKGEVEKGTKSAVIGAAKVAAGAVGLYGGFKFFEHAIKDAAAEEAALASLRKTVEATGESFAVGGEDLGELLSRMEETTGRELPELSQGLARLVTATGSVETGWKDLGIAMDVAQGRHMGLAQAAVILAKAEGGNDTALRRLGIILPKVTKNVDELRDQHDQAVASGEKFTAAQKLQYAQALKNAEALDKEATRQNIISELQRRFGGQTAAFAASAAGQYARLRETVKNVMEEIGGALLPGLAQGASRVQTFIANLRQSETFQRGLANTVDTLGSAFHGLGAALSFVAPGFELVVRLAHELGRVVDFGGLLIAVTTFKGLTFAVNAFTAAQARWTASAGAAAVAGTREAQAASAVAVATDAATLADNAGAIAMERYTIAVNANTIALERNAVAQVASSRLRVGGGVATGLGAGVAGGLGTTASRTVATGGAAAGAATGFSRLASAIGRAATGLVRFIGPTNIYLAGIAAGAYTLYKVVTATNAWDRANKTLRDSINDVADANGRLRQTQDELNRIGLEIPSLRAARASAALTLEKDREAAANARASGNQQRYREALIQVQTDLANLNQLTYALNQATARRGELARQEGERRVEAERRTQQAVRQTVALQEQLLARPARQLAPPDDPSITAAQRRRVQQLRDEGLARKFTEGLREQARAARESAKALADSEPEKAQDLRRLAAGYDLLVKYTKAIKETPTKRAIEVALSATGPKSLLQLLGLLGDEGAQETLRETRRAVATTAAAASQAASDAAAKTADTITLGAKDFKHKTAEALTDAREAYADAQERLVDTIVQGREAVADAQQNLRDTIAQGRVDVADAVNSAKQNLNALGGSLADSIGKFFDAGDEGVAQSVGKLTPALKRKIEELRALTAQGVWGPKAEQLRREIQAGLALRDTGAAGTGDDERQKRKERVTREISDLTALRNTHAITEEQFEKRITKLLEREGINRRNIRKRLGVLAAQEYQAILQGLFGQGRAEAAAARKGLSGTGTGLVQQVIKPVQVWVDSQKNIAAARNNLIRTRTQAIENKQDAQKAVLDAQHDLQKQIATDTAEMRKDARLAALRLYRIDNKLGKTAPLDVTATQHKGGTWTFTIQQPEKKAGGGLMGGGMVTGPGGTDTIPALLTAGEIVLNQGQQQGLSRVLGMGGASPHDLFSTIAGFARGGVAGRKEPRGSSSQGTGEDVRMRAMQREALAKQVESTRRQGMKLIRAYQDRPYRYARSEWPPATWHNLGRLLTLATGIDPGVVRERLKGNFGALGPGGRPLKEGETVTGVVPFARRPGRMGEVHAWEEGGEKLGRPVGRRASARGPRTPFMAANAAKRPFVPGSTYLLRRLPRVTDEPGWIDDRTPALWFDDTRTMVLGKQGWTHGDVAAAMRLRFKGFGEDWPWWHDASQLELWSPRWTGGLGGLETPEGYWKLPYGQPATKAVIRRMQDYRNAPILTAQGKHIEARKKRLGGVISKFARGGVAGAIRRFRRGGVARLAAGGPAAPSNKGTAQLFPVGKTFPSHAPAIDHVGPRMYRWRSEDHERVPMQPNIDAWAHAHRGRGISTAKALAGADWWRENWPTQNRFQRGGAVDRFRHERRGPIRRAQRTIPLGRYALNAIGHDAPHLYTVTGGRGPENPVPMRKNITSWLERFKGRGLSPAKAKAASEWWEENWPAQMRFQGGGVADRDGPPPGRGGPRGRRPWWDVRASAADPIGTTRGIMRAVRLASKFVRLPPGVSRQLGTIEGVDKLDRDAAQGVFEPPNWGKPPSIRIRRGLGVLGTLQWALHEMGHSLDWALGGGDPNQKIMPQRAFASDISYVMSTHPEYRMGPSRTDSIWKAISRSRDGQNLRQANYDRKRLGDNEFFASYLIPKHFAQYWSLPHEMFARAFQQWVATKASTTDIEGRALLHGLQGQRAWSTGDFRPISAAFDSLLGGAGGEAAPGGRRAPEQGRQAAGRAYGFSALAKPQQRRRVARAYVLGRMGQDDYLHAWRFWKLGWPPPSRMQAIRNFGPFPYPSRPAWFWSPIGTAYERLGGDVLSTIKPKTYYDAGRLLMEDPRAFAAAQRDWYQHPFRSFKEHPLLFPLSFIKPGNVANLSRRVASGSLTAREAAAAAVAPLQRAGPRRVGPWRVQPDPGGVSPLRRGLQVGFRESRNFLRDLGVVGVQQRPGTPDVAMRREDMPTPGTARDYVQAGFSQPQARRSAARERELLGRLATLPAWRQRGNLISNLIARQKEQPGRRFLPGRRDDPVPSASTLRRRLDTVDQLFREGLPISSNWYGESALALRQSLGGGGNRKALDQLAGLIAVYSARTPIFPNVGFALRARRQFLGSGRITVGDRDKRRKATAVMKGADWRQLATDAPKTKAFYANLLMAIDPRIARQRGVRGDEVTIDRWMAYPFGLDPENIRPPQYQWASDMTRLLARHYNVRPYEAQAAVWAAAKARWDPDLGLAAAYRGGGAEKQQAIRRSSLNYAQALWRPEHLLRLAIEAYSEKKPWLDKLSPGQLMRYTHLSGRNVVRAIRGGLGMPARLTDEGRGSWLNPKTGKAESQPAFAVEVPVGSKGVEGAGLARYRVPRDEVNFSSRLGEIVGAALQQAQVGWLRQFRVGGEGSPMADQTAWRVNLGRRPTNPELDQLNKAMGDWRSFYYTQAARGFIIARQHPENQLQLPSEQKEASHRWALRRVRGMVDQAFEPGTWDDLRRRGRVLGFSHYGGLIDVGRVQRADLPADRRGFGWRSLFDLLRASQSLLDAQYRGLSDRLGDRRAGGSQQGARPRGSAASRAAGTEAPRRFQTGGVVRAVGTDSVPALLTPGELVISRPERGRLESGAEIAVRQRERMLRESQNQTRLLQRIATQQRTSEENAERRQRQLDRTPRPTGAAGRETAALISYGAL